MPSTTTSPRIIVIGAGARGKAYAKHITQHTTGQIVGVAEPSAYRRGTFCARFSLAADSPLVFSDWRELVAAPADAIRAQVDGVCICTLDETHVGIVLALRHLDLHVLCEKPLATNVQDCRAIYDAVVGGGGSRPVVFSVGHVLRYSPHNRLLRKLVCEDGVLGDVVNVNHTEPVGWWHFTHSYVRGNWRSTRTAAPSLLTKCCHDIDLLLWLLCSPYESSSPTERPSRAAAHLPSAVSSHGSLVHFRPARKPPLAGTATNCLSCEAEPTCQYSAKKIYVERHLRAAQNRGWPNDAVAPELEDAAAPEEMLLAKLAEDYGAETAEEVVEARNWYGRCVFEAGNDVVDNQVTTLSWEDSPTLVGGSGGGGGGAKTATLTMIAHTQNICKRFTKIYGTRGELTADSDRIEVTNFDTGHVTVYNPEVDEGSGHGGGDAGLAIAFIGAIAAVLEGATVEYAQKKWIKCTPEEALRSHEAVFWAEDARTRGEVLKWDQWKSTAQ